ncbi:UNVERIFIED_ORG: hypothetical protein GGE64_002771 [Rhizobium etli]
MSDMSRMEFEQAVGEEFGSAVCPPVPFEDASAHECYEVILDVLGHRVTPEMLSAIPDDRITTLAARFGAISKSIPRPRNRSGPPSGGSCTGGRPARSDAAALSRPAHCADFAAAAAATEKAVAPV